MQPVMFRNTAVPRKILCRVDVDDDIWVLITYEAPKDASWERFKTVKEINAYVSQPRINLECPQRCLTVEQSNKLVSYGNYYSIVLTGSDWVYYLQVGDAKRKIQALEEELRK